MNLVLLAVVVPPDEGVARAPVEGDDGEGQEEGQDLGPDRSPEGGWVGPGPLAGADPDGLVTNSPRQTRTAVS